MAKMTTASKAERQLGELLQEQQEPFTLEVYLSERGRVKKNLKTSGANFSCCHGYSGKSLSQNESKKCIPHFSKVLKVILRNKFFEFKGLRTKNSNDEDGKLSVTGMNINNKETADRFFSFSSKTVYNSCPESDIDDEPPMLAEDSKSDRKLYNEREKKSPGTTFEWSRNCMEENKKHSPHSVLEEISFSTGSQLDNSRRIASTRLFLPKLLKEDSILSASLLNLLLETRPDKSGCAGSTEQKVPDCSNSSRSSISKRALLQQTKQFIFDCFRNLIENKHDKEDKRKGLGQVMRCEKTKGWGRRCGDESSIKRLLELGIINSTQEWRSEFESQKRDIGLVIGNVIAEEITSEVTMDMMIKCPSPRYN